MRWWKYILIDFPSIIISFYQRGYDTALKPFRFPAICGVIMILTYHI